MEEIFFHWKKYPIFGRILLWGISFRWIKLPATGNDLDVDTNLRWPDGDPLSRRPLRLLMAVSAVVNPSNEPVVIDGCRCWVRRWSNAAVPHSGANRNHPRRLPLPSSDDENIKVTSRAQTTLKGNTIKFKSVQEIRGKKVDKRREKGEDYVFKYNIWECTNNLAAKIRLLISLALWEYLLQRDISEKHVWN